MTVSLTLRHTLRAAQGPQFGLEWSGDGVLLATAGRRNIFLWDVAAGDMVRRLDCGSELRSAPAFSPNGRRVAALVESGCVILWDCESAASLPIHSDNLFAESVVAWSPSRDVLATGTKEGGVDIWDCYSGAPKVRLRASQSALRIAWSPDSQTLASAGMSTAIFVWNAGGGLRRKLESSSGNVQALALAPSDKRLASGGDDNLVRVWDLETGKLEQILDGHSAAVVGVAYSHDGRLLASKSLDGTVRLWDSATGDLVFLLDEAADEGNMGAIAFHPSKPMLASIDASDGTAWIREYAFASATRALTRRGIEVFVSYAHRDTRLKQELEIALKPLENAGLIQPWYDHEIPPGAEWEGAIDEHLRSAQVILLLISPDFIASQYCYGVEMKQALVRHSAGTARVVPILLRDVVWETSPFAKLQALPSRNGVLKPVASWKPRDGAFREVALGIRRVVEALMVG
jgi:hypothetical protein